MNFLKKSIILTVLFLSNLLNYNLFSLEPQYIKGTYSILKDEYKHLSPLNGAVWWESGFIQVFYDHAQKIEENKKELEKEKKGLENIQKQISSEEKKLKEETKKETIDMQEKIEKLEQDIGATLKLVTLLFHEVQGSLNVSYRKSLVPSCLFAKTVAKIIRLIEQNKEADLGDNLKAALENDEDFNQVLAETETKYEKLKESRNEIEKEIKDVKSIINEATKTKNDLLGKLKNNKEFKGIEISGRKISEIDPKKEDLNYLFELNNQIENFTDKLKKEGMFSYASFFEEGNIQKIKKAFKQKESLEAKIKILKKEVSDNNYDKLKNNIKTFIELIVEAEKEKNKYPLKTLQSLFLTFLYKKAVEKKEFKDYLEVLNKNFEGGIFIEEEKEQIDKEDWLTDNYQGTKEEYEKINNDFKEEIEKSSTLNLEELFKNVSYEDIAYLGMIRFYMQDLPKIVSDSSFLWHGIEEFTDCMETTVRNLSNIVLYDKKKLQFVLNEKSFLEFGQDFLNFYNKHNNIFNIGGLQVHKDWLAVVEGIPYVLYANVIKKGAKGAISSIDLLNSPGNMYEGFVSVPLIFENWNLIPKSIDFKGNVEPIELSEFKSGLRKYLLLKKELHENYSTLELQPCLKNIIVLFNKFFDFKLYEDESEPLTKQDFNSTYFPQICEKFGWNIISINNKKRSEIVDLGILDQKDNATEGLKIVLEKTIIEESKETEEGEKTKVKFKLELKYGHGELNAEEKLETSKCFKDFSSALMNSLDGYNYMSQYLLFDLQERRLDFKNSIIFLKMYFSINLEEKFKTAIEATQSGNYPVKNLGFDLFKAWVEKGQGYKDAIKIATTAIKRGNYFIQSLGFNLFKALIEKGKGYKEAIDAASVVFKYSEEKKIVVDLLDILFEKLKGDIEKGQGYKKTIETASESVKSEVREVRDLGLYLFYALVEKGQGYEKAIEAASEAVRSENSEIRDLGLDLFDALVEKGQGYEKAIEVASKFVESEKKEERISCLYLFYALVEKGQGYEKAIEAASESVKSEVREVRSLGLNLFKVLIEKANVMDEENLELLKAKIKELQGKPGRQREAEELKEKLEQKLNLKTE